MQPGDSGQNRAAPESLGGVAALFSACWPKGRRSSRRKKRGGATDTVGASGMFFLAKLEAYSSRRPRAGFIPRIALRKQTADGAARRLLRDVRFVGALL